MELDGAQVKVLQAMDAAEPAEASVALGELTSRLRMHGTNGIDLEGMWIAFKALLHRRGYYVSTPAEIQKSLQEIDAIGSGFDLYDLAQGLARYDAVRTECKHLTPIRALPALKHFCPACPCGKHRKERN